MKKFYCNGKKGVCLRNKDCDAGETQEECEFYDGTGGEEIEEEDEDNGKD